jgi:hypothetical protein
MALTTPALADNCKRACGHITEFRKFEKKAKTKPMLRNAAKIDKRSSGTFGVEGKDPFMHGDRITVVPGKLKRYQG